MSDKDTDPACTSCHVTGAGHAPDGDGLAQHPVADGDDEAGLLGHRDELAGRHLAQLGVAPADQRLGAHHVAGLQVDLRLVVQAEALAGQRLAHGMVQPHALAHVGVLVRLVEAEAAAPALLGALHGRLGMAHQHLGIAAVGREQRHAHAAGQRELQAVDGDRHRRLGTAEVLEAYDAHIADG